MFKEFACARVNTNIFLVFVIVGRKCVMPFFTLYLKYLRLTSLEVGIIRGSQSWIAMIFIPIWVCFVKRSRESLKTRVLLLISVFLTASMYSCLVFVPPIGKVYDVTHCDSLRSGNHEIVVAPEHSFHKPLQTLTANVVNYTSSSEMPISNPVLTSKPSVRSNASSGLNAWNRRVFPTAFPLPVSKIDVVPTATPKPNPTTARYFSELVTPTTEREINVLGKVKEYSSEDSRRGMEDWKNEPIYEVLGKLIARYKGDGTVVRGNSYPSEEDSDERYNSFKAFKNRKYSPSLTKNGLSSDWPIGMVDGRISKVETTDEEKDDLYPGKKNGRDDMYSTEDDWDRISSFVKTEMDSDRGVDLENGALNARKPYRDRNDEEQWGKEMNRVDEENQLIDRRNWGSSGRRKISGKKNMHEENPGKNAEPDDDDLNIPKLVDRYDLIEKRGMKFPKSSHLPRMHRGRISRSLLSNDHIDVIPVGHGGLDAVAKAGESGPLTFQTVLLLSGLAELFACMPVPAVTTLWWLHLDDAEHTEQFGEHRLHALMALVPAVMALVVAISRSPCSLLVGPHQITLHLLAAATVLLSAVPLILALPLVPASKSWRRASDASAATIMSHRGYVSGHQILAILTAMLGGGVLAAAGEYVFWHMESISGFPHNYELLFGGSVAMGALMEAVFTAIFSGRCVSCLANFAGPLGLALLSAYLGSAAMLQQAWIFVALGGVLGGAQAFLFRALYGAHPGPGDATSGQATGWRFGYGLGCFVSGFLAEVFGTKILFWSAAGVAAIWALLSACCYKLILPPVSASLLRVHLGQKGSRSRRRHKRLYSRLLFPPEDGELLLKGGSKGLISGAEDGGEVEMEEESDWLERALREDVSGLKTTPANL